MELDKKIDNLLTQFKENDEEIAKLKEALVSRENLKFEITGALKALNAIKEESETSSKPKTKKGKKATA